MIQNLRFPPGQEEQISSWLQSVKFRRKVFGGVDEKDVWTKLSQLNELYVQALAAERARYDALLAAGEHGEGREDT